MRTFISSDPSRGGIPLWNPPDPDDPGPTGVAEVIVFDGVESVRGLISKWYEEKLSEATANALARADQTLDSTDLKEVDTSLATPVNPVPTSVLEGVEIIEGPPIQDRGSSFIARVCSITHPSQASRCI